MATRLGKQVPVAQCNGLVKGKMIATKYTNTALEIEKGVSVTI
ncbi:hypothetical protein [Halalkalibacter flavus]